MLLVFKGSAVASTEDVKRYADNFALLDHNGVRQELYYYSDKKAVVLIWQSNGSSFLRKSLGYINKLKSKYEPHGIQFLMINANAHDNRFSISEEAAKYGIDMPILEDVSQVITNAFNVKKTAEVVVINPDGWRIIYQGAIGVRFDDEKKEEETVREYLKDALESVVGDGEIRVARSEARGEDIDLKSVDAYTYTDDVAPILLEKCFSCHYKGGVAPWSMDSYEKVRGWGAMIREVVKTNRMPPWQADPYYGEFTDSDSLLSPEELRKIVYWVENGFKRGEGKDPLAEAPLPDDREWTFGEPDIVVKIKDVQDIPAEGILQWRYLEGDYVVEEDLWIRQSEVIPSNPQIAHHATVMVVPPGSLAHRKPGDYLTEPKNIRVNNFIGAYVPGRKKVENVYDMGVFVPKGYQIVFQMHYVTTGRPAKDQAKIGLYLHDQEPFRKYKKIHLRDTSFRIPPGEKNYKVSTSKVINKGFTLYGMGPHMHYRGKSAKFIADYPDGKREVLLSIPRYVYNWQFAYAYKEPKHIPEGTRITFEAVYDNSAQNPYNPDPTREVSFGSRSFDEMFNGFLGVTYD